MQRLAWRVMAAGAAVLAAMALAAPASAGRLAPGAQTQTTFTAPVKVTPDLGFGYEPGVVIDRFGNIFATAHKENWQLVAHDDRWLRGIEDDDGVAPQGTSDIDEALGRPPGELVDVLAGAGICRAGRHGSRRSRHRARPPRGSRRRRSGRWLWPHT